MDRMQLLRKEIDVRGTSEVARRIGYSPSAVSQLANGKYKGDPARLLEKVAEIFGGETVHCPVKGKITLGRCAQLRKQPFAATNPARVHQYRACKECDRR